MVVIDELGKELPEKKIMGIGIYINDQYIIIGEILKHQNKKWVICKIFDNGLILLRRTNWRGKVVEVIV